MLLPVEIISIIAEAAADNERGRVDPSYTLAQCSIASKTFHSVFQPLLYRHISLKIRPPSRPQATLAEAQIALDRFHPDILSPPEGENDFEKLAETLATYPHLAQAVRSICLSFDKQEDPDAYLMDLEPHIELYREVLHSCPRADSVTVHNVWARAMTSLTHAILNSGVTYHLISLHGKNMSGSRDYAALGKLVYQQKEIEHLDVELHDDPSAGYFLRPKQQPLFRLKSLAVCHTNCYQDVSQASGDTLTWLKVACSAPANFDHLNKLETLYLGLQPQCELSVIETALNSLPTTTPLTTLNLTIQQPCLRSLNFTSFWKAIPSTVEYLDITHVPASVDDCVSLLQDEGMLPKLKELKLRVRPVCLPRKELVTEAAVKRGLDNVERINDVVVYRKTVV